jgi:phosphoglucosamine mutase
VARSLFGTDGIRGVAGEYPLDATTAGAVGEALAKWVLESHESPKVVIGMDTRESGTWLASSVAGGLANHGVEADFAGVTTTPGVAYLAKTGPFAAGVMISASHNGYKDNGIKVIGHSGYKLPDSEEESLEAEIFAILKHGRASTAIDLPVDSALDQTYIDHLASTLPQGLGGLRIVCDCANGSASQLAPELFQRLGSRVSSLNCAPNGKNINLNCGSMHLGPLREQVLAELADVGVAFDGDADRALFISSSGEIIDGDAVLMLVGRYLKNKGALNATDGQPIVVATVMSNLGLEHALHSHGIRMARTPVGDKYVLEEMVRIGAVLGGEQSGHVIFHQFATTGDGMLTALRVFEVMGETGLGLDELTRELQVYPQRLVNVRVKERKPLGELPNVQAAILAAETSFGDSGRVLVRFSGTEPLARVMVEGPDLPRVEAFANNIASKIRDELGAE